MPAPAVLILGGTGEARELAARLHRDDVPTVSSLAGRVQDPALPAGQVRIGGFGGPDGLAGYLRHHRIRAVVDATHPFAQAMSASAALACDRAQVPLLRLARPGWADHPLAPTWQWVDDYPQAATAARGERVLLTTGRTTLRAFADLAAPFVLARLVEPVIDPLPAGWAVVTSRGPYTEAGEHALLREHRIAVLITKDSGGAMTQAKLVAADRLAVRVVIVRRPPPPAGVATVDQVAGAADWTRRRLDR